MDRNPTIATSHRKNPVKIVANTFTHTAIDSYRYVVMAEVKCEDSVRCGHDTSNISLQERNGTLWSEVTSLLHLKPHMLLMKNNQ